MDDNEHCRVLNWDLDFFEQRIARLELTTLDKDTLRAALSWCDRQAIDCLYFLAESNHQQTIRLAETHGFQLMDVRLRFERDIDCHRFAQGPTRRKGLRLSRTEDILALRKIASVSHRDSRFYYDPNFSDDTCDELYATWIDNSCRGYADAVLVGEFNGQVAGYVTCHLRDQSGEIGLLAVAAEAQGQGLGRQLVSGALQWFAEQGIQQVSVVTQGRNVRAQRLYQDAGFLTESLRFWYHRWFARNVSSLGHEVETA